MLTTRSASLAVMSPGTELCRETDVLRLMEQVQIETLALKAAS